MESGWERRRTENATRLQGLALELFARRGYRSVTMDEIAERAGISTRTLFRYFPNKDDLLLRLPRRTTEGLRKDLEAIGPTDDPLGAIWHVFAAQAPWQHGHREAILLWRKALNEAPEVLARVQGETTVAAEHFLTKVCATALGVDPDTDVRPRVLAATLAAANRAVNDFWLDRGALDDLEVLYAQALDALRTGLPEPLAFRA